MANPTAGVTAAQIAQQKLQDPASQPQVKQGPSKFDHALEAKATQAPKAPDAVAATQQVQQTAPTEKASWNKLKLSVENEKFFSFKGERPAVKPTDPVAQKSEVSKSTQVMAHLLSDIERGQEVMDKLINAGLSGQDLSQAELLSLQASVYKYTQELELTGKVVEKATTGLKDTLKTQV